MRNAWRTTIALAPTPVERKRRVVVDYGGPNVAKGMHVGHLRASIIGESVKRIYRFRGDEVWGDAHFGDWGFQMGLVITALEDELGGFDDNAKLDARLKTLTLDQLEAIYPTYAKRVKEGDVSTCATARAKPPLHCKAAASFTALSGKRCTTSRWPRKSAISPRSASISICGSVKAMPIR